VVIGGIDLDAKTLHTKFEAAGIVFCDKMAVELEKMAAELS
jgi:hypothetical protein